MHPIDIYSLSEEELIEYIKNDGDINICTGHGYTLLMHACNNNYSISTIKLLLNNNIYINIQDFCGTTALIYALWFCDFSYIKLLIESGANMDLKNYGYRNELSRASGNKLKMMLEYKYSRRICCYYHVYTFIRTDNFDHYINIFETPCSNIDEYGYFYSICAGLI